MVGYGLYLCDLCVLRGFNLAWIVEHSPNERLRTAVLSYAMLRLPITSVFENHFGDIRGIPLAFL